MQWVVPFSPDWLQARWRSVLDFHRPADLPCFGSGLEATTDPLTKHACVWSKLRATLGIREAQRGGKTTTSSSICSLFNTVFQMRQVLPPPIASCKNFHFHHSANQILTLIHDLSTARVIRVLLLARRCTAQRGKWLLIFTFSCKSSHPGDKIVDCCAKTKPF